MTGVAVSNEQQVVLTDERGHFSLPFIESQHHFVCVSRPEGHTGGQWYQRLPLDGEARFVLKRSKVRTGGLRIAHVTDLHLNVATPKDGPYGSDYLKQTLADVLKAADRANVLIATGDLTDQGDIASLAELRRILDAQPVPVLAHFGGHDGISERGQGEPALPYITNWQDAMGPTHYSLDAGGWHIVLFPDEMHFFRPLDATRAEWLEADLEMARRAGKPILLARHTPPDSATIEKLGQRGVRVILHGHWHSSKAMKHAGVLVLATAPQVFGGIDYTPRRVRVVALEGDRVESSTVALRTPRPARPAAGDGLSILWESQAGGNLYRGEPLSDVDAVYIPVPDEHCQGKAAVLCLDARTGARRWRTPTPNSVRGALAVAGETLYAVTQPGEVLAIDKTTGQQRWSRQLDGFPDRWIYNGPVVSAGIVLAGTGGGRIEGLRVADGAPVWSYPEGKRGSDSWSHYCTPAVREGRVVVMRHRKGVACLDAATGKELWHFECAYEFNLAAPCPAGRLALVPASKGSLYALEFETGKVVWERKTDGAGAITWAVDGDLLVLHTLSGPTECRRLSDGELLWRFQGGPDLLDVVPYRCNQASAIARPVFTAAGVLVFGLDGCASLLDRKTGVVRARLPLGEAVMAAAPGPTGSAIVALWDGRVVMLRAK